MIHSNQNWVTAFELYTTLLNVAEKAEEFFKAFNTYEDSQTYVDWEIMSKKSVELKELANLAVLKLTKINTNKFFCPPQSSFCAKKTTLLYSILEQLQECYRLHSMLENPSKFEYLNFEQIEEDWYKASEELEQLVTDTLRKVRA